MLKISDKNIWQHFLYFVDARKEASGAGAAAG